jgi:hypothetical protein
MSRKSIRNAGTRILLAALAALALPLAGGCGSTKAAKEPAADATAKTARKASSESIDHGLVREGERIMIERAKRRGAVATPSVAPAAPAATSKPAAASVPTR